MARRWGQGRYVWTVGTVWLPAAILVVITVPALLLAGRLPDPVAAHWSGGVPDGSVPLRVGLGVAALIWAACWACLASPPAATVRRLGFLLPTALFVGGVLSGTVLVALALNLDAPQWSDARQPDRLSSLSPLLAGCALAGVAILLQVLSRPGPNHRGGVPAMATRAATVAGPPPLPASRVGRGERVIWVRRVCQGPTWIAILLLGLTTLGIAGSHRLWWVVAGALVVTGMLLQATVWIDRRGVRVGLGPWGWPARAIALEDVRSASVVQVDPADFGGWGYRLWRDRTNAIVMRRGEALRVEAAGGRVLLVTVDGASDAAAVLTRLVQERYYSS